MLFVLASWLKREPLVFSLSSLYIFLQNFRNTCATCLCVINIHVSLLHVSWKPVLRDAFKLSGANTLLWLNRSEEQSIARMAVALQHISDQVDRMRKCSPQQTVWPVRSYVLKQASNLIVRRSGDCFTRGNGKIFKRIQFVSHACLFNCVRHSDKYACTRCIPY
jgi:hypothetical protein